MNENRGLWRGKRIDNGEWAEGYYFHQHKSALDNDVHYIVIHQGLGFSWSRVDPATLGECTGLTDKNGKLIFEGDILRKYAYGDITDYIVTWWESNLSFILVYVFNPACHTDFITSFNSQTCEVIGNIFDDPELLKTATGEDNGNAAQCGLLPAT